VNRELLKDDELDQQLEGITVLSDEDRIIEVYFCCHFGNDNINNSNKNNTIIIINTNINNNNNNSLHCIA